MKTVRDFIFLGSKITADGDCSHEIKRCLLLGRKAMTNLNNILKNRNITFPTKSHRVKAMVFPVVMSFPCGSAGKESACNEGDLGSIPGLGRSPGERKGYPLQDSGLGKSRDSLVQGVAKSRTRLSDFHFHAHFGFPAGTAGKNPPASAETVHGIILSQTLLKQLSIHTHTESKCKLCKALQILEKKPY